MSVWNHLRVTLSLMGLNLHKLWQRNSSRCGQKWNICVQKSNERLNEEQFVVSKYRWGSTDPLHPAAAGSSPPLPRSDERCYKALLKEINNKVHLNSCGWHKSAVIKHHHVVAPPLTGWPIIIIFFFFVYFIIKQDLRIDCYGLFYSHNSNSLAIWTYLKVASKSLYFTCFL